MSFTANYSLLTHNYAPTAFHIESQTTLEVYFSGKCHGNQIRNIPGPPCKHITSKLPHGLSPLLLMLCIQSFVVHINVVSVHSYLFNEATFNTLLQVSLSLSNRCHLGKNMDFCNTFCLHSQYFFFFSNFWSSSLPFAEDSVSLIGKN